MLAGAALFKATPAPDASFWQAEKERLLVVTEHDLRAIYNGKCDSKKTCITVIIHFLRAQNEKCYCMEPEPPGATFFCLEPEPTHFVGTGVGSGTSDFRSQSSPKKWRLRNTGINVYFDVIRCRLHGRI